MMNISTIIILYNSTLEESNTLNSILQANLNNVQLTVNIWNNGPAFLQEQDIERYKTQAAQKNINIVIYQDIRNIALSKIYNFVLAKSGFDFFIPLDQDTVLSRNFFQTIAAQQTLDLILPLVYIVDKEDLIKFPYNEEIKQPVIEEQPIEVSIVTSVTSGMALSKRLIEQLINNNLTVFDESFAFYGVDTSFFLNVRAANRLQKVHCGCFGQIEHSLSTYVQESSQASYRRKMELLYYTIIYRLNYKKKSRLSVFFNIMPRFFKGQIKDIQSLKNIFYCLMHKKHPRAQFKIAEH